MKDELSFSQDEARAIAQAIGIVGEPPLIGCLLRAPMPLER
jgi:hypothetical protein